MLERQRSASFKDLNGTVYTSMESISAVSSRERAVTIRTKSRLEHFEQLAFNFASDLYVKDEQNPLDISNHEEYQRTAVLDNQNFQPVQTE
jgi:hypothetical protein